MLFTRFRRQPFFLGLEALGEIGNIPWVNKIWSKQWLRNLSDWVLLIPGYFEYRLAIDLFLQRDEAVQ